MCTQKFLLNKTDKIVEITSISSRKLERREREDELCSRIAVKVIKTVKDRPFSCEKKFRLGHWIRLYLC